MRVVLCTDTYPPQVNGVARTLARLVAYLQREGHAVLVLAPQDERARPEDGVVRLPALPLPLYPELKLALPLFPALPRRLAAFQPDIFHLATEFSVGLAGLAAARELGVPAVSSYHTHFPQYLLHYRLPVLAQPAWSYLRWFHNSTQLTFCPSADTAAVLTKQGVHPPTLWGRGVDTDLFTPARRDAALHRRYAGPNGRLLLYVGRLAPEKGLPVLLAAFALLKERLPRVSLVLAGDGPLRADLERRAPAGVRFAGYVQGVELARLYASADVFAFPSTTETYGNVLLEALASGLPVVAPLAGGLKENLKPGENGLAALPDNPADTAHCLMEILTRPELAARLARAARSHALGRSWERALAVVPAGYQAVLARQAGRISA